MKGMKTKHTPGPWFYKDEHRPIVPTYQIRSNDKEVACVSFSVNGEANAKLIAAAPDLLEALNSLLSVCKATYPLFDEWIEYKQAVTAIKKATE